jgi:hypothetical protein
MNHTILESDAIRLFKMEYALRRPFSSVANPKYRNLHCRLLVRVIRETRSQNKRHAVLSKIYSLRTQNTTTTTESKTHEYN